MLHDPGGLATQEPAIQKMDNYYSDSNNTSSSSSEVSPLSKVPRVTGERKTTTTTTATNHNHRRSSDRAKDLHRLNAPQLIDLVLHLESQLDKTETRLKKYVLRCKEHVESETQASEQANKFRQKMTQVILDAQQEAAKAKQDVGEYKLRFENVQKELQRSREVVQILENDKDEIQRALHRARDRAREYKEQSAVQLAREQGRRVGFEQGLEQGRLAVQLAHARAVMSALPAPTTSSRTAPRRRRALTQGTDGATTPTTGTTRHRRRQSQPQTRTDSVPSQHGRRSSLDSIQETGGEPTSSRPRSRPPAQAQTDRSNASGPEQNSPSIASTSQRSNSGPAAPPVQPIPPIPPPQQFPAGVSRDDVSEATTSPASTMTGMDILTFREAPVVSTSPTSSPEIRKSRGGQTNTTSVEDVIRPSTSGGHPPGRTVSGPSSTAPSAQQISHSNPIGITIEPPPLARPVQQHPPVGFQPDENLLTPTFLPSHTLPRSTSAHSLSHSNRSSFSFDIQVESPSQPSTPRESDESSSGQDGQYLSPNGSRPVSLPRVQPQTHESPVLPVLPRIVSQSTKWGTPAVLPLDLASAVYEEAPTPPGFHYPAPLGAAIAGGVGGKGKGKSVTPAGGGPSSSSPYYTSSPYVSKPDSSSVSTSQQPVVPPVTPKISSSSSPYVSKPDSSSLSTSQQPVVPPVTPKTSSSSSSYVFKPDSSSVSTSQQPVVPPVTPRTSSLSSSSSSSTSSSQQPVVPPVTPNVGIYQGSQLTGNRGNGYHRNEGDDYEEGEEDTSFDSATKRNTQWNSMMYSR